MKFQMRDVVVITWVVLLLALVFAFIPHSYCKTTHAIGLTSELCAAELSVLNENVDLCTLQDNPSQCYFRMISKMDEVQQCELLANISYEQEMMNDVCYYYHAVYRENDPSICQNILKDDAVDSLKKRCIEHSQ